MFSYTQANLYLKKTASSLKHYLEYNVLHDNELPQTDQLLLRVNNVVINGDWSYQCKCHIVNVHSGGGREIPFWLPSAIMKGILQTCEASTSLKALEEFQCVDSPV